MLYLKKKIFWLSVNIFNFLGLIVGAIIRYAGTTTPIIHLSVEPEDGQHYNQSLPPDTLWLKFPGKINNNEEMIQNKTYAYTFRSQVVGIEENEMDFKATFDPEIFFNIILPPIIFHAGNHYHSSLYSIIENCSLCLGYLPDFFLHSTSQKTKKQYISVTLMI